MYKQKDKRRKKIKIPRSSATLDTAEFTKYINDIRRDYPFLPDPEDRNIEAFYMDYYYG